jgi:hypothetical protein
MRGARPTPPSLPKVAMVSTRELDGQSMAGRLHVAIAVRDLMDEHTQLTSLILPNVLTGPTLGRLISAVSAWLGGLLTGSPLPLQCALFADARDHQRLLDAIPMDVRTIYLDGVRSYSMLRRVRRQRPYTHIVVDFDDLMSRRMALLLEAHESLSPGYLTKRLPVFLQRLMMAAPIGRTIVGFERIALDKVERKCADLADAIVLASAEDARVFVETLGRPTRASVEVIASPGPSGATSTPLATIDRFVFIGSDSLTQNRMTIEYLTDLWARHAISTPLVLVGLRASAAPLPPGVTSIGYVERIADVYNGHSLLLTPALIGGGIKTKVLEAFAFGSAAIGNALTFEAMDLEDYPLNIADEARLVELVSHPERYTELFHQAAAFGAAYLQRRHNRGAFVQRWREVMAVPQTPAEAQTAVAP